MARIGSHCIILAIRIGETKMAFAMTDKLGALKQVSMDSVKLSIVLSQSLVIRHQIKL